MSYIDRYNRFIDALKGQTISTPVEMHHIVPKSMGGTDDKSNLIALTLRQHYIAHWMLWKAYGGKMAQAFHFMTISGKYKAINSRAYEALRKEVIVKGEQHPWYGKKHSSKSRKRMSESAIKARKNPALIENLRKHRANQVIPAEVYERQSKVISSLVWMNDGNRSYRVRPELVNEKLTEGFFNGRLMEYVNNEGYRQMRSQIANRQWQALKSAGHTGKLKGLSS